MEAASDNELKPISETIVRIVCAFSQGDQTCIAFGGGEETCHVMSASFTGT